MHQDIPISQDSPERFETLITGKHGLLVERIVSHGHSTPAGEWYDQERDEWVLVLEGQASIGYADSTEVTLKQGDCLFIPRHVRHRVIFTSSPCIWLAVHAHGLVEAVPETPQEFFKISSDFLRGAQ